MKEYIEREAVILALGDEPEVWCEHDPVEIQERNDWNYYKHCIEAVPAADVVPVRHGRWIFDHMTGNWSYYSHCSECGHKEFFENDSVEKKYKYCYSCGALMDGKEE